jgi:hypothetical protein
MRKLALAAALGLSLAVSSQAFAGTTCTTGTYATGFENPPFAAGSPLVGQDGWTGVAGIIPPPPPNLSPNAAVISTDLYYVGLQSVRVKGADLVHQDFINTLTKGYYDAIGSYRCPVNLDVGKAIVRVQAVVRVEGPQACARPTPIPCNNFFSASVAARAPGVKPDGSSDTVGVGELAISSDGKVYGYSGDDNVPGCPTQPCDPPASFLTSAPVTLGAWHKLAVDVNFATGTFSFSVDDKLLPGGPFSFPTNHATVNDNKLRRGSLVVYAAPDTRQLHKNDFVAHFDNFSIILP